MKILIDGALQEAAPEIVEKYLSLIYQIGARSGKRVYRGENFGRAAGFLNVPVTMNETNVLNVLKKLFIVGAKGKYYISNPEVNNPISEFILSHSENITPICFKEILREMRSVLLLKTELDRNSRENLVEFIKRNRIFHDYYIQKSNEGNVLELLEGESDLTKLYYRDYLLYFMHTLQESRFHERSVLLSTTTNIEVTHLFIEPQAAIIYEYFIPSPQYRYAISYNVPTGFKQTKLGKVVPSIKVPLFDNEQELSVRRALLPHFILRILDTSTNSWILNPALQNNQTLNDICKNGFEIDQTFFYDIIRETNYVTTGILQNGKWSEVRNR